MVDEAVAKALAGKPRVVLAVSGGTDSMALLEAAARTAYDRVSAVATFDHGTGDAARFAAALVADRALALGLKIITGRSAGTGRSATTARSAGLSAGTERPTGRSAEPKATEATWRAERWAFLREVAREAHATIVTAHTRDDQVETVVMRIMRSAGARGLAGLYADSDVIRPLVDVPRSVIAAYVQERGVQIAEDPTNQSRRHLRNRIRLDLLPALRGVRPEFDDEMLAIARRASEWRREVEWLVKRVCPVDRMGDGQGGQFAVAVADLAGYDAASLAIIWPAIAARAGVTLDWRGTSRLVAFTTGGRVGSSIQLSGGVEVVRTRAQFVIRR